MTPFKKDVRPRLHALREDIRDPLLTGLTFAIVILVFGVVPLHAAGTISVDGYGFVILLLLAAGVLMRSTHWIPILALVIGIGLGAAAALLRARLPSDLDLYLDAFAWIDINVVLIVLITGAVFAPGPITYHRISGAVLLYLTVGMTFVGFYTLVGLQSKSAFSGLAVSQDRSFASTMIYFSFTTLTSVGYGDIIPVHPVGRALANIESIIGQLFPATLLARLVTLELEDRQDRKRAKTRPPSTMNF